MKLNGEGTYALTAVKLIEVTNDFLDLAVDEIKCQNKESFEDCTTKLYLKSVEKECNCIPYRLRNFTMQEQVKEKLYHTVSYL